jgi:hypothetical protein
MPATHETFWGSTFCDDCYERLKDLITRNESPDYDWHICAMPGCGRQSCNTIHNVAYPNNEEWLCEKHWRQARMTTMVQEETGGWSLCNFCHAPLDLLDGSAEDAAGKRFARNVQNIDEPVTCYLVTPAVVQVEQIPPIGGAGENWHRLEHKQFLLCSRCWDKLEISPGTIGCGHQDGDSRCGKPAIQHIEENGISRWHCLEHWQDQPEVDL